MQGLKTALKEAARVFLFSRLIILLVSYIGVNLIPPSGQKTVSDCVHNVRLCLLTWHHWDAVAYARIAAQGYGSASDTAFFPFWPLLEHLVGFLLGGVFPDSYHFAGLLLANTCFYCALVLFYCLLSEDFEPELARRALFYLAFYPYAMFFFAGYTESLFLLLCLAAFLFLRRGRAYDWWLAGLCGFLAAMTRSAGVMLAVPFLVVYLQRYWTVTTRTTAPHQGTPHYFQGDRKGRPYHIPAGAPPPEYGRGKGGAAGWGSRIRGMMKAGPLRLPWRWLTLGHTGEPSTYPGDGTGSPLPIFVGTQAQHSWLQRINAFAPIMLIPAGVLVYMLYLGYTKHDALIFISQEATAKWNRHLSVPGSAFIPAFGSLFTQPFFTASVMQNILDITFTLLPILALVFNWRRIPLHYALFAAALVIFSLSFPQTVSETLASQPRYMLSIFPVMAIFAFWGKRPAFDRWFIGVSLPLLAVNVILFISHYWVA